jgi:DNA repair photolyase
MGRDIGPGFDRTVEVRMNFPEVLREELRRRPRSSVAFGTATDPYQQCEGRYRLMRRSLEALLHHPTPTSIVTKGTLVVRDRDLLTDLSRRTGGDVRVIFSIATLDERFWRDLEPRTPAPRQRLRALRMLVDAGITCGVLLAPILPGITDSERQLDAVVNGAAEHGASMVIPSVLKLDAGIRDFVIDRVAAHDPAAAGGYRDAYPGSHPRAAVRRDIDGRVREAIRRCSFPGDVKEHERRRRAA